MLIDNEIFEPVDINSEGRCQFKDIAFVNTSYATKTGKDFLKNGVYTSLDPIVDKKEYQDFWDREEAKRKYGITLPGKLCHNDDKGYYLQNVHITGEHYGYINFAPIIRTVDVKSSDISEENYQKIRSKQTGKKDVSLPDFWDGDYYYFHARKFAKSLGKHMTVAKARRKGYSYKNAWIAVNTYDLFPNRTTIVGAYESKYLVTGDATMIMVRRYLDWLNTHTDWNKSRIKNALDSYKSGFKEEGKQEEFGFLSSIIGLPFVDNPDAAIGKDAEEIFFEEAGKFPNLIEALDVTIPTLEDGDLVTGMITIFGTGGTKGANWYDFERIFYNPEKFNMLIFENVWDKNARGTACCYFHPMTLNMTPYMDKNGNSMKVIAKKKLKAQKDYQKEIADTPEDYVVWCGQRADSPEEAFTKNSSGYFYTPDLEEHYKKVKHSHLKDVGRYGEFTGDLATGKGISFLETDKNPPIIHFPPRSSDNLTGCFSLFYPLYRDPKTGEIPEDLYRIWHDPFATEKTEDNLNLKDSLGSAFLYERPNTFTKTKGDLIIGCYTGRPLRTDDYNEQLFKMLLWANADMFYENDRGDVHSYAKRVGLYHRLVDEPEILWNKEVSGKSGRGKGISIGSGPRKSIGAQALKDWLYTYIGKSSSGTNIYNYHNILDLATLEELLDWNMKGNFDRVSALIVGMYDRKEFITNIEAETAWNRNNNDEADDFFDRDLYN